MKQKERSTIGLLLMAKKVILPAQESAMEKSLAPTCGQLEAANTFLSRVMMFLPTNCFIFHLK
jgi:hypothetical protein